jgi:ppGpp synthetase/RelA/SpoT-type nucleotidyltranferase
VTALVLKYFQPIETKDLVPESEWEFGYFGKHFVLLLPSDIVSNSIDKDLLPQFFELQVKTLFQHAWSEANHDLGYKPQAGKMPSDAGRRLAFTSAQAWGADHIFDELFREV